MTDSLRMKTEIAPAMKNAGTRQDRTWSLAYSWSIRKASTIALWTAGWEKGTKYAVRKTASRIRKIFVSFISTTPNDVSQSAPVLSLPAERRDRDLFPDADLELQGIPGASGVPIRSRRDPAKRSRRIGRAPSGMR